MTAEGAARSVPLAVAPGAPLAGAVRPPGDKSITHRAYLFALLADGETIVEGANPGADCRGTLAACAALGMDVREEGGRVRLVHPGALRAPGGVIDCGNSGSTMRMLPGVLAGQPFTVTLTGDASLVRRPVARIVTPLSAIGARVSAADGDRFPPLTITGGALSSAHHRLEVASAQVATCLELAATFARGTSTIEVPGPARDHSERMLPAFGIALECEDLPGGGRRVRLTGPVRGRGTRVRVPGDPSAAAFFLAAAAARPGARVTARGIALNPTRTGLLDVLAAMGAQVTISEADASAGEPVGDVTVTGPERLRAVDVPAEWVPRLIDEVPAWIIAAAAADGTSRLGGAAELRVKESDRLAALARGLAALGIAVGERPDGLEITGGRVRGGSVAAAGDHRIAMAFAVLGTLADGPVTVDDAASIATSYPGFAADLAALGGAVQEAAA
jgi:3-phosphoshikimate 1-carboxyvinyltransferase